MSNAPRATTAASVAGFPEGAEGVTPPASPEGTGGFLSDVIVDLGFVDRETVERAVDSAREPGRRVDLILLQTGALTEEELSRAIAERYGFDHVDLGQFEVNMGAASLISRSTALRYRAVPVAIATDGALIVAVADPVDPLGISDIEVMTKSKIRTAVAGGSAIDALAERLPEVGARQPVANNLAPGRMSPPSPVSQPSQSPPASEAPGDPRPADGNAAASALEAEIGERELRDEGTSSLAALPEAGRAAQQGLGQATASEGAADGERREAQARIARLEAELAEAHDVLRHQAGEAEAERGRLQQQVIEVTQERDRLREAVEQATQERDLLRDESGQSRSELDLLRAQIRELENADRRAETARLALTELREESEREREQSARLERKLRDELSVAEVHSAALERRLSGLMAAAANAEATAHELVALLGSLTGEDLGIDSEKGPR